MSSTMLPLSAGDLRNRFVLQSRSETSALDGAIVPTWTTFATVWGSKKANGIVQQLESESSGPRRAWELTIRRRSAALPTPLRIIDGASTLFALSSADDAIIRDRTVLDCVEGVNMAIAETATIYRGSDAVQTDRSIIRTWSEVDTGVRLRVDEAEASLTQRLFGQEIAAEVHGTSEIDTDLRVDDGILITAGRHAGEAFIVTARKIDPRLPAQAYFVFALTRTTEVLA